MLRVKPTAPFTVREFAAYLDEHKIGNRMLFGGNLHRQPVFVQLKKDNPHAFRVVEMANSEERIANPPSAIPHSPTAIASPAGPPSAIASPPSLSGADTIMHTALFLGTYPGLSPAQLDHEIAVIHDFVANRKEDSQGQKG